MGWQHFMQVLKAWVVEMYRCCHFIVMIRMITFSSTVLLQPISMSQTIREY